MLAVYRATPYTPRRSGSAGEVVRERGGVGVGVRAQERVLDGLVRARCVVVLRVRLAGGRVVEPQGCRTRGAMGQRGGDFFYIITYIYIINYNYIYSYIYTVFLLVFLLCFCTSSGNTVFLVFL